MRSKFLGLIKKFTLFDILIALSIGSAVAWIPTFYRRVLPHFGDTAFTRNIRDVAVVLIIVGCFLLFSALRNSFPSLNGRMVRFIAGMLLLVMSAAISFFDFPFFFGVPLCILASFCLATVLFLPISGLVNYGQSLGVFALSIVAAALLLIISNSILDASGFSPAAYSVIMPVLIGTSIFIYFLIKKMEFPKETVDEQAYNSVKKPTAALYCIFTFVACSATAIQIIEQISKVNGVFETPPEIVFYAVTALFAAAAFFMYLLAASGFLWYVCYSSAAMYCLGIITMLVPVSFNLFLKDISIMLLTAAASGISVMFVTLMFFLSDKDTKPTLLSAAFLVSAAAVTSLSSSVNLPSAEMEREILFLSIAFIAVIFLLAPALLRQFDAAAHSLKDDGGPEGGMDEKPVNQAEEELLSKFTNSEKRVYALIMDGYSNQEIADALYVSINTVKFHVKNILGKSGMKSKYNLIGYAKRGEAFSAEQLEQGE